MCFLEMHNTASGLTSPHDWGRIPCAYAIAFLTRVLASVVVLLELFLGHALPLPLGGWGITASGILQT